jgi:LacI family transcriptional regulator
VSIKTVSRVVNNQGEISEATKERVQEAIEALGYQPNALARGLVRRRSNTLGVVAWGLDYFGPSRTVVGIEQQSDELGYSLMLHLLARPDETRVTRILNALVGRRVDGIVWAVPEIGENRAWIGGDRVEQLPPIVFLSMAPRPGVSVVANDNRLGAALATQHLIERGRRTIGLITGPLAWWEARERRAGWEESLCNARLEASASLVVEGDWSAQSGERGMRELLERRQDIDAVFACNDPMALGALQTVHRLRRKVPEDLAIVGFDNIPEAAYFLPPLSSVFQPLVDVGRLAVQVLHDQIEAELRGADSTEPMATLLEPQLVVRQSSLSEAPARPGEALNPGREKPMIDRAAPGASRQRGGEPAGTH